MLPPYGSWARGQNPYDLVTGFRDIMKECGCPLSMQPNPAEIHMLTGRLTGRLSGSSAFEHNAPKVADALRLDGRKVPSKYLLDLIDATGTLNKFGLRTVHGRVSTPPDQSFRLLLHGATIPWIRRRIKLAVNLDRHSRCYISGVFTLASNRPCNLSTELNDPLVVAANTKGEDLLEDEALRTIANQAGFNILGGATGSHVRDTIPKLLDMYRIMVHAKWIMPTNANATYLPLVVRRYFKQAWPDFDTREDQFYLLQDGATLARTPVEADDPAHFQRPLTVIPALVLLVRELYFLNGGTPFVSAA